MSAIDKTIQNTENKYFPFSIVGVLATIFVMLTVTVKYFTGEHHPVYVPDEERTWSKSFSSIPAIFFAYQVGFL